MPPHARYDDDGGSLEEESTVGSLKGDAWVSAAMSDADNPGTPDIPGRPASQGRFDFSTDELERYFKGTWKIAKCDVCGMTNQWTLSEYPIYSVIPSSDGVVFSTISDKVTVYLRVFCNNCGNTKFMSSPAVRGWLSRNHE